MGGFEPRAAGDGTDDQKVRPLRHRLAHSAAPIRDFPFAVSTSAAEHPTREDVLVTIEEDRWSWFVEREASREIQRLVVIFSLPSEVQEQFVEFLASVRSDDAIRIGCGAGVRRRSSRDRASPRPGGQPTTASRRPLRPPSPRHRRSCPYRDRDAPRRDAWPRGGRRELLAADHDRQDESNPTARVRLAPFACNSWWSNRPSGRSRNTP